MVALPIGEWRRRGGIHLMTVEIVLGVHWWWRRKRFSTLSFVPLLGFRSKDVRRGVLKEETISVENLALGRPFRTHLSFRFMSVDDFNSRNAVNREVHRVLGRWRGQRGNILNTGICSRRRCHGLARQASASRSGNVNFMSPGGSEGVAQTIVVPRLAAWQTHGA